MTRIRRFHLLIALIGLGWAAGPGPAAQQTDGAPAAAAAPAGNGRSSRLQGSVFIDRYRKVVGATAVVRPQEAADRFVVTSTDARGVFDVDELPDGDYRVLVEREGFETIVKDGISVRFPFRAVVELPMTASTPSAERAISTPGDSGSAPSIVARGTVEQRDGLPLEETRMRLVRPGGGADPRQTTTGADGTFAFEELPAGPWNLEVVGVGYLPIRTRIRLDETSRLRFVLVRQPADYQPSPLDLMPPERPVRPAGLERLDPPQEEGESEEEVGADP